MKSPSLVDGNTDAKQMRNVPRSVARSEWEDVFHREQTVYTAAAANVPLRCSRLGRTSLTRQWNTGPKISIKTQAENTVRGGGGGGKMATTDSKNRILYLSYANLPERERETQRESKRQRERESRRFDAGICSYSGWMLERNGGLSLAAAGMLLPLDVDVSLAPAKPLAVRRLQPIRAFAVRGAEAAEQMCQSCCCCC